MMVYLLPYVMMFLMITGGGRGGIDTLDMAGTDSYWQLKHVSVTLEQLKEDAGPDKPVANVDGLIKDLQSQDFETRDKAKSSLEQMGPPVISQLKPAMASKDPEVAAVATDLVKRFTEHGQERAIRRLMAIRTLGERQEKDALPLLKTLLDSKELFVADYAERAIAKIEGKPLDPIDHQKEFAGDLALLPKNLSIVFQTRLQDGGVGDEKFFDKLIDDTIESVKQEGDVPPDALKKLDKAAIQSALTRRILSLVERVGDIRLEGMTLGASDTIGDDSGWAVIHLRGKYNAQLVYAALKPMEAEMSDNPLTKPAAGSAAPELKPGEIPQVSMGSQGVLLLPSNDTLIYVTGSSKKEIDAAVETTTAALKAGKGTLADNADLMAQIKLMDAKDIAWGVMKANDELKKNLDVVTPFDMVTLELVKNKDTATFTFKAEGTDAEKVKTATDGLTGDIQDGTKMVQAEAAQMKSLQPAVEFLQSMKVAADGKKATFTGEIKPSLLQALLGSMGGSSSLLEMLTEEDNPAPPVEVQPLQPAQPVPNPIPVQDVPVAPGGN